MSQRFNVDTNALKEREQVNTAGAVHNLEDWIVEHVHPSAGMRMLDLGCGTGKQVFAFAKRVAPSGAIVGVDISRQAVDAVNERARQEKLSYITAVQGSLDNVLELMKTERFDLIISTYAFYYATDMKRLFAGLHSILKANGQIFICGPADGTNQEMLEMMNRALPLGSNKAPSIKDFMDELDVATMRPFYKRIVTVRLLNHIRFLAPESVLQWWRNHNSYVAEIDGDMTRAVHAHFERHGEFLLSKNVLGVHAHV